MLIYRFVSSSRYSICDIYELKLSRYIQYDMCPQRTVNGSEDCLYLTLYSRPWTEGAPKKPVMML